MGIWVPVTHQSGDRNPSPPPYVEMMELEYIVGLKPTAFGIVGSNPTLDTIHANWVRLES